ncbi:GNAT family N-acetyltransferase [Amycolatopsis nigrescens]|uniref:GNAT family N-acetyltransferase n=1 Tax=Amycolatopsis nigrescens TaxID=381445 RepID=UPI000374A23D|nr:GNAT family N-acetyltransferase [Amycolatopsis nigrescens]
MDPASEQPARFAGLDPLLPRRAAPPPGDRLTAELPDGRVVSGSLYRAVHEPGSREALEHPRETWELTPATGTAGAAGLDALLAAWRDRLAREPPGQDSGCLLAWPSRDTEVVRPLLAHGFAPAKVLGVRTTTAERGTEVTGFTDVTVRPAGQADLEELVALELAELRYARHATAAAAAAPEDAAAVLRPGLRAMLTEGRVWVAETGGVTTGMVTSRVLSPAPGSPLADRIPPGRWGFVGTLSVAPSARGRGTGRALMAEAHGSLHTSGVRGTFLFYNPINPLSSVFWHRQGYRPLWTFWSVRPASALR